MSKADRAQKAIIGEWSYPHEKYCYDYSILFKQTNVMGNTYFSNYIELQGVVRESFLLEHPCAVSFLQENPNIALITHSLYHRFYENTYFGSRLRVELNAREIRKYSVMLVFRYYDALSDTKVGEGWQKVCFADRLTNDFCAVPQLVLDLVKPVAE